MKSSKMLLTALGVFAIVGSALALNSSARGSIVFCGTVQNATAGTSSCPRLVDTDFIQNQTNGNRWCTRISGGACNIKADVLGSVE